jgi:hypothetical protein
MLKALALVLALGISTAQAAEQLNEYGETAEQAQRLEDLANHQRFDYLPVILICPAGMEFWQCSPVKGFSRAKVNGQKASNLMACVQNAYEMAAKAEMFSHLAAGEYIKVMCDHLKGSVEETGEGRM